MKARAEIGKHHSPDCKPVEPGQIVSEEMNYSRDSGFAPLASSRDYTVMLQPARAFVFIIDEGQPCSGCSDEWGAAFRLRSKVSWPRDDGFRLSGRGRPSLR